ncbi:MAG: hypothetical protein JJ971_04710 [Balneolaceae bacterium]|nr:hypothetical protein [Balneolaceae bacterium]MBO6545677.1 hypothetical protein [Balneolaceae bacterium]MBO6647073.1 hypothetical protein [Balneolaceae bacterium]
MKRKDRQIQLFLQIFLLLSGIYLIGLNLWNLNSGMWNEGIFEFYNGEVPVFKLTAGFITGFLSLISFWALWIRAHWGHGFTLFVSGLLFAYNLIGLGEAIFVNPYHAIPMVFILIITLQSFPFLIRRTTRYL